MPERRTSSLLSPQILWPLFVIALLLMSVGTVTTMVLASRSDGGAKIVEDYYQKAVQWDTHAAERRASAALGWDAALTVAASRPDAKRFVQLTIVGRDGAPVTGLSGTVQAGQPHRAERTEAEPFQPTETPGTYRLALPLDGRGIWDFEVRAHRGDEHFVATLRHEIRAAD